MNFGEQWEKNVEANRNLKAFKAALEKAAEATVNGDAEEVSVGYAYEGHSVRAVFRRERAEEQCSCEGCCKS